MADHDNSTDLGSDWTHLGSGTLTDVWTNGELVRRASSPWGSATHRLLLHLEQHDVHGTPRFVACEDDTEMLTYLPGQAIRRPWPEAVQSPVWMEQVGRWLQSFHTAGSTFRLPKEDANFAWGPDEPEPGHVVTHGDLGPWNMIECDGEFAGVIDWDLARFGDPLDDLAEVAFELCPLRANREMLSDGATKQVIDARLASLCRGYGAVAADEVLRHIEPLYQRRIAEMTALADDGQAPFVALAEAGMVDALLEDFEHFRELARTMPGTMSSP